MLAGLGIIVLGTALSAALWKSLTANPLHVIGLTVVIVPLAIYPIVALKEKLGPAYWGTSLFLAVSLIVVALFLGAHTKGFGELFSSFIP